MASNAVIVVFAKAPVPGEVKTRLIPALGAHAATQLHIALTGRVLQTALSSGVDVMLAGAPDASHAFFASCATNLGIGVTGQLRAGNLGARMLHTLDDALENWLQVVIVGADCPVLSPGHLQQAIDQLATHDVVLTPADDGGYVLIGARRTSITMFDDIDWGTGVVLTQQRERLRAAGLSWHEMETLWDVDRPEDLPRLTALNPPLAFSVPI